MALSLEHSHGLHTSQPSSSSKDDNFLSSDSSSGGIRIGSIEQEMGNESSAVAPEALCEKVKLILKDLLHVTENPEDLQVKYIGRGSYHKVVGFKIPDGTDHPYFEGGEYVVRIQNQSRADQNTDMERDVAILDGLAGKIDVPISRVLTFDTETMNPLGAAYTIATRLPGFTLESIAEDEDTTTEQNCCMVEQVTYIVEKLASITAPYPGLITSTHGEGIDETLCPSGIPMMMFDFPFDTLPLTTLTNPSPLTFMLALVDQWTTYEATDLPSEDNNFASWMKIKAIIHALSQHDILGSTFHLVHGDLAARNILGIVINDSTIEITGVVDWDFASFAPAFCAYRTPLFKWSDGKDDAEEWCEPEELDAFKTVASPEYLKYAFSDEAVIARKVWAVLREGMVGEYRRIYAGQVFREWENLQLEGRIVRDRIEWDSS
jgi:aminoglycoside phosphotransferase (APT) family kinase protein